MRRVTMAAVAILALSAMAGCKKKQATQYVDDGNAQLAIAVRVADPKTAIQLVRGFYDVEDNAWRWTAPKFAVTLRPPNDVAPEGAKLFLEYAVPDLFLQKVPETTLTVTVGGKALAPEKIQKAGAGRLERLAPAELLKSDMVTVEFSLDKYLEAGSVDQRELGLIVSAVGFQTGQAAASPAK
ncbi:MAG TPA: hypothetical protein VFQ91_26965 [Bryobacteraceae bacterium]|nr:hypothetical protein [Bryobacteraceae bacterium]